MDDDDEIAVYIVPKLDEAAADEAEQKLKDKFKDVAPDLGKGFFDALGDSGVLDQLGDKLKDPLKDLTGGFGVDLGGALDKALKKDMGGALDDVVGQLGTKLGSALSDPLKDIGDTLGVHLDDAISKALKGDTGGALDDILGQLGTKVGTVLTDPIKDLTGGLGLDDIIARAHGLHDTVSAFRGHDISGGLSGTADLLGGLGVPGAGEHGLLSDMLQEGGAGAVLGSILPGPGDIIGGALGAGHALWSHLDDLDKPPESHGDATAWSYMALGQPVPQNLYGAPAGSAATGGSTTAGEVEVQARDATVSAGSVTLAGGISLPSSLADLQHSPSVSGGAPHAIPGLPTLPAVASHAAVPAPHGGEIHPSDLLGMMGLPGHDQGGTVLPGDSPGYDNLIGLLPSGSTVGLEGGEGVVKPGAMQNPGVADIVASLNQHYDEGGTVTTNGQPTVPGSSTTVNGAPATNTGPPQTMSGTGESPTMNGPGGQSDQTKGPGGPPGAPPGGSGSPAGGTQPPAVPGQEQPGQVGDPHGSGSGFGLSGGLIGMAEGAATAAAGMTPAGPAGSAAMGAATQEVNNAVGFLGQLGSILAFEMPIDTLGLDDSPLGNPANSWYGKLGMSLVGGHNDTPNMAGKTQAPLTSNDQQGQQGQPGGSPLGGQQGGGGVTVNIGSQTNNGQVDHDSNFASIANQLTNTDLNAYQPGPGW